MGKARQTFARFGRFPNLYFGGALLLMFGAGIYLKYFRPTAFLYTIKHQLIATPALMEAIGGAHGYDIDYPKTELPQRPFRVKIKGACPEASVTVRGVYTDTAYTITDTVVVKCPK